MTSFPGFEGLRRVKGEGTGNSEIELSKRIEECVFCLFSDAYTDSCVTSTKEVHDEQTAKGLAFSRSHSLLGGCEPTNKTYIGEVISSIDGGNFLAIVDGCCR